MNDSENLSALQGIVNIALANELSELVQQVQRLQAEKDEALRDVINLVSCIDAIDTALHGMKNDSEKSVRLTGHMVGYYDCIMRVVALVDVIKARHGITTDALQNDAE